MTIPVFRDQKIVGVVGVANKATDYDDTDVRQLTLMMDSVWKIVERQQAEETAKAENAKLSAMISGMDEGIVFANADNVVVEINEYLCRFTGRTREEIIGRRIEDLHHGPVLEKVLAQIDRFRTTPDAPPLVLQRPLGHAEVILRMQPIYRDGQYDGVLLNVVDVTELVRARQQAEDASRAKSFFLANMSHEIRTPMTAIMGYTDLLADDGLTPNERDGYLSVIHRNGHHLLSLINDMLDLSKIEAGKMSIELARCNLPSVVADVASIMRVRADERAITLAVEYLGPVPTTILTDADRLRQALVNLVGNAIKFTETGGVRIVVSLLKEGLDGQPVVQMQVIDTGIGIAPETVQKLFEPFEQADVTTSRRYGGTGLGLAITRRIATLLGGTVSVETQLGKGSTFTLVVPTGPLDGVPMVEDPAEAMQRYHDPQPDRTVIQRQALDRVRVLLVEDGMDNQRLISTVLRKAGATVDIAENGHIAVRRAENGCYDVVLMDMQMPVMDGFEATRILRGKGVSAPILALTAHAMATDRQRCLDAGCDEHLTKPIDRVAMIEAIRRHVDTAVAKRVNEDLLAPAASGAGQPISPVSPTGAEDMIFSSFAQDNDLVNLVEAFIAGLPQQMRVMRNQLAAGLFEELRRAAHQLKGAGGGYGYPTLTDAAASLENAARADDAGMATAALAELSRRCDAAIRGHIHGTMFRGDVR
jgi:PAS domain S-box-containing protein